MLNLHFPWLHPRLLPRPFPDEVFLLDPGIGEIQVQVPRWTPDDLPLNRKQARRYLDECLRFGGQFNSPKDLSYFARQGVEDFYSGSVQAIQTQLRGMDKDDPDPESEQVQSQQRRLRAQMMLILFWSLEEKLVEVAELDARVAQVWSRFDSILGMDEDGRDERQLGLPDPRRKLSSMDVSWQRVVPFFLELVPDTCTLCVFDPEVFDALRAQGVAFRPSGQDAPSQWRKKGISELQAAQAPGWLISGLSEPEDTTAALSPMRDLLYFPGYAEPDVS